MLKTASAGLGLLLAALLGASYLLAGPMPPAGTPPSELVGFLATHSQTQEWSWFLASGPALLIGPWFAAVLSAHLWQANPADRYLTVAGFATAMTAGALLATGGIAWGLFVYLGTQINSPSLLLVLAEARHFAEGSVGFPAAGAMLAFSWASRRHLPGWQAVLGLGAITAGLQLANGIDDFVVDGVTGALGPAAFSGLLAWLSVTSLALAANFLPWPRMASVHSPQVAAPALASQGGFRA